MESEEQALSCQQDLELSLSYYLRPFLATLA
jgi:hypothetical protein